MLNIQGFNNVNYINSSYKSLKPKQKTGMENTSCNVPKDLKPISSENFQAYLPSFGAKTNKKKQITTIEKKLDSQTVATLKELNKKGILDDNNSNDGSTVLENLYKIATEPRIQGLNDTVILKEVINALNSPESITQKFGDLPDEEIPNIEAETGEVVPEEAKQVASSSCVAASMEYNLASKTPAEFTRFAQGLSGQNYSVTKKIKMEDIGDGIALGLWKLRTFNTESKVLSWDDVEIKIEPDRNAIVRARVQTSYKDPGERSCVDVLMQSALLNLGSQASYNTITDERAGTLNPDNKGLNNIEKNFVENVVFDTPKVSLLYQNIDQDGKLAGYNCQPEETKQHILNSLKLGQNVIIGYTHFNEQNQVDGGHEITITDYIKDKNGNGYFICNDTDDDLNEKIPIEENKLLPLIHHADIPKEALNPDDVVVEAWREILDDFKTYIKQN